MLPSGTDVMGWAREEARRITEQERGLTRKVTVSYDPARQIAPGERRASNVGYLFLQDIYSALGLDGICRDIASRSKAEYDLDSILSRLVYGRVIEPSSKRATAQFARELTEGPSCDAHHIYRALSVLAENLKQIEPCQYNGQRNLRFYAVCIAFGSGRKASLEALEELLHHLCGHAISYGLMRAEAVVVRLD